MSNTPLLLADNLFENTILHPSFTVYNPGGDDTSGHEAFRAADNLRDLTWWTPVGAAPKSLDVDTLTNAIPDTIILDRGHNLAGQTIVIKGAADLSSLATGTTVMTATIPTTAGGLPSSANGCLTAEGVWWKTFFGTAGTGYRAWRVSATTGGIPVITGLYLGTAYRFPVYLNTPFADDYRTDVKTVGSKLSRGGVRVLPRRLNFRKFRLNLDLESTDYPAFDAAAARPLLRYGQPWWICIDDSDATQAGLMAPFQIAGDVTYEPGANPLHREIRSLELEEVIPRLWV